jgi:hypothetical protein
MANSRLVISPEEAAELKRLYAAHFIANKRAVYALRNRVELPEVLALQRFVAAEAKVMAIVVHIRDILGITGQLWNL